MNLIFSGQAWEEYQYWISNDKKTLKRINLLIEATRCDPYEGIGKPEALKHALAGYWSRRITDEQRFVYKVRDDELLIAQLRYHY